MQTFHLFFSRWLRPLLTDLQKPRKPPEIEVITPAYPIQFCYSPTLTGSLNCKTVLKIEVWLCLCLKRTLEKFQKSMIFWLKNTMCMKRIFKMCFKCFNHIMQISIKKMFSPMTNAVKSKPMPVAQIGFLFQITALRATF